MSPARTVVLLLVAACVDGANPGPPAGDAAGPAAIPPSVRYDQHLFAGGKAPPGDSAHNPFAGQAKSAVEGKQLFSAMNCDGCHGGGEGWVAPSLGDGRWRYGGSDAAIYQSIFYGRPKGMPAFGGLLAPEIIWKLVSYLQSLPLPKAVPTQAW
jgi:cytochrome c oxidase cbb3-type subunit 3